MEPVRVPERFVAELHQVLQDLYDPIALRRSPLLGILGLKEEMNPSAALRRVITEAIGQLKPDAEVPPYAPAWRIYRVLVYRYVEQSSQFTVAATLGLSVRQLRRQERLAEKLLADHLWSQYHLNTQLPQIINLLNGTARKPSNKLAVSGDQEELDWLRKSLINERIAIPTLVARALKVVTSLANQSATRVITTIPADLPLVTSQLIAARQAVLSLLTAALYMAPGGQVQTRAAADSHSVVLEVRALAQPSVVDLGRAMSDEHLAMTRQLADLCGISLTLLETSGDEVFRAALKFPIAEQLLVVVIDDNTDTLKLFERYLAGSRFRFVGQTDPAKALAATIEQMPNVIVLDVMLPGIDGWELLDRLRTHPQTANIPIVVCTILPQESLALSLGATAFLRKPVSQEGLLLTLERLVKHSWPESQ
ncbi:MAG: response regulator [Gemmatales bacterium]|nr:response regulator [Gemmatales bacterium]